MSCWQKSDALVFQTSLSGSVTHTTLTVYKKVEGFGSNPNIRKYGRVEEWLPC